MSDVIFASDTTPMPAFNPPDHRQPTYIDLLNRDISFNKSIVSGAVDSGEYRIVHIRGQRPDGQYDCLLSIIVKELKICHVKNYHLPFTL
jgi:hypothetical protein